MWATLLGMLQEVSRMISSGICPVHYIEVGLRKVRDIELLNRTVFEMGTSIEFTDLIELLCFSILESFIKGFYIKKKKRLCVPKKKCIYPPIYVEYIYFTLKYLLL